MQEDIEIKVFIVEDDPIFISILCDVISHIQKDYVNDKVLFTSKSFYSVKEARYELKQKPDIVLLDYHLIDDTLKPATSDQLLEGISKSGEDIKVIIVSAETNPEIVERLKSKGASLFISKSPKTLQRIIPALKMVIDKVLDKKRDKIN